MVTTEPLDASLRLLDDVFDLGCTAFDTAHVYGSGDNERAFGRWIHSRGVRDQVVILGKGAHHNRDRRRVTPFDITADIYDSLARMGVDYIDLYVLHRDDPEAPVGPIVEVLNEHKAAGRIHAFGGSNWHHERLIAANAYAAAHRLTPFAVSSPNFSLAIQFKEPWENCVSITGDQQAAARRFYAESQMPVFAWSSLAGGFFSGRFRPENLDRFDKYLDRLCVESYCYPANFERLDRAQALAAQRGVSIPQIAMAYVMDQPWQTFALVGCANRGEFEANAAALAIKLTSAEVTWLETGGNAPF